MTPPLQQKYRGERLGLPESGPGSIAPGGRRAAAFAVDAVLSALFAGLLVNLGVLVGPTEHLPGSWSLVVLGLNYVIGILAAGRTLGMNLLGLRIIRVSETKAVNPLQALIRTGLLFLLVPAVVWDRDGRGLHDRFSDTAVITS